MLIPSLLSLSRISCCVWYLDDSRKEQLNERLQLLGQNLAWEPEVEVVYFQSDPVKHGGTYVTVRGKIKTSWPARAANGANCAALSDRGICGCLKTYEQLDLFTDYEALEKERKAREERLARERRLQEAVSFLLSSSSAKESVRLAVSLMAASWPARAGCFFLEG